MKYSTDDMAGAELLNPSTISCPSCHHEFELSEVLTGRIREHLRSELLQEVARREKQLRAELQNFKAEKDALLKAREALDEEVERKLNDRLKEAESRAAKKVETRFADQLKEMQDSLKERDEQLQAFRANEVVLRRKTQELERAQAEFDIQVLRKVEEECGKIRQETEQRATERHRLKDLEKDKLIEDLKLALDDMKRKAEQRSMQLQGEVLELDFEAQIGSYFPHDLTQPVPKGVAGADLVQNVRTPVGSECGIILWETKNTKSWSNQWIPKLKEDMITTRASLAILVSVVLPEGIKRFGLVDGVWVCDPLSALPLATALRHQLMAVNCERQTQSGKSEKMELLYQYLAGSEFRQKIENIIEAFRSLQDQVQKERRVMEKQWKQREKQIARVMRSTVGLHGDLTGIIGGAIQPIPALELEDEPAKLLEEGTEADEEEDDAGTA